MSILRSMDAISKAYSKSFNEFFVSNGNAEITFNSYQYIIAVYKLHKEHNATISAIAQRLGVKKSSTIQMINILVKKNYLIQTNKSLDKRGFYYELGEKGFEMMRFEAAFSDEFLNHICNSLDKNEVLLFERIIDKLVENIRKETV